MPRSGSPSWTTGWLLVSDIDGTLTGDDAELEKLMRRLAERRPTVGFGVASGRSPTLVREAMDRYGLNEPDIVIASVGTEMMGPGGLGELYREHVGVGWDRDAVVSALEDVTGLEAQGAAGQGPFKVSFNAASESVAAAQAALAEAGVTAKLIHSAGRFLDVIPAQASKGEAVRFAAAALGMPLERVVVAGDTGNDADMLTCGARAVVVANYDPELEPVLAEADVYRARGRYAAGVLEGLERFGAL